MITRSTPILAGLCVIAAAAVFQLKHSVVALHAQLDQIESQILEERLQIRLLAADWAHLTRPDRLVAQAERLGMVRADARRIVHMEQIGRRSMVELARQPMPVHLPSGEDVWLRVKPLKTFAVD